MQVQAWPRSVGSGSGIARSCGIYCRCGSHLLLLWLWCRPAAEGVIDPWPGNFHMLQVQLFKKKGGGRDILEPLQCSFYQSFGKPALGLSIEEINIHWGHPVLRSPNYRNRFWGMSPIWSKINWVALSCAWRGLLGSGPCPSGCFLQWHMVHRQAHPQILAHKIMSEKKCFFFLRY